MTSQVATALGIAFGAIGVLSTLLRELFAKIRKSKDDAEEKGREEGKTSTLFLIIQTSVGNLEKAQIAQTGKYEALQCQVNDHETRITVLEKDKK